MTVPGLACAASSRDDVAHLRVGEHRHADDVGVGDVGHAVRHVRRPELAEGCHRLGAHVEYDQATGHSASRLAIGLPWLPSPM